ncbi:type IIS restriction enzyme Eco57I [bacterium BMS3Abin10]|nr:type IIS restriction enzyme Eco57I [bacterium BMS3Abin10]
MSDIEIFKRKLQNLVAKFEKDKTHYLSKGYPEAQVRIDFLNPFFKALNWDIENKSQKPPHDRDVIVELSPETTGRPDYNFRINGDTKFFIEAKAPSIALDDVNHILQAKSYAWSTKEVSFVILTDFEEFKLYDASLKPNPKFPNEGLIFDFKYTDYFKNIEKLWELSKKRVEEGSLEALLPRDTKSRRLRIPPDKSFLEDLTHWRTVLAKDIHKRNSQFDVKLLNDVVQRLLDRIIFIRIAEDRKIRPDRELWEIVAQWKEEGKRKSIMTHLVNLFHEVNDDLNGDIFKPHACEKAAVDSGLLAEIIDSLYFPKSRYRFDAIGVELLGSIYERYLGSTIRVTPQRVKVEKKPEVRKAGGVYYTPKYIVDYIVKHTVGELIADKTPKQIEKIKILDPACGSGSFILGAYQYLIDYHLKYYREHPKDAQTIQFDFYSRVNPEDFALPLREKAKILRNNIFGVDIDPQAVEITMMSLYLKALEGERGILPKKQHLLPSMSNNIKCGNSLIGYDILEGKLFDDDTKSRINPFDWSSKATGFGAIMQSGGFDVIIGNPPYGYMISQSETDYYSLYYKHQDYKKDFYLLFLERYNDILSNKGFLGVIVSNTWLQSVNLKKIRKHLTDTYRWLRILYLPEKVFSAVVDTHALIFKKIKKGLSNKDVIHIDVRRDGQIISFHALSGKFIPHSGETINIVTPQEGQLLFKKTLKISSSLSKICDVYNGVKPFEKGKGTPPQTDKVMKEKPYVKKGSSPGKSWSPLLRGEHIQRYENKWNSDYWIKYGPWLAAPRNPSIFEASSKIYVRQTGDSIKATLIPAGFIARNNIHILLTKDIRYSLQYVLALMNSRFMDFAYTFINPEKGEALAEIKKRHVEKLPIRTINFSKRTEKAIHDKLVKLVDGVLDLHKKWADIFPSAEREKVEREITVTDEKIDEIVYDLYGITNKERTIIEEKT